MELRKKYILRRGDDEATAILVRAGDGRVWVETGGGERIDDAVVLDNGRSVSLRLNNQMYFIDVTPRDHHELRALINGRGGLCDLYDELGAAAAEQEGTHNTGRELRADMPGLVVDIKCAVGDTVLLNSATEDGGDVRHHRGRPVGRGTRGHEDAERAPQPR